MSDPAAIEQPKRRGNPAMVRGGPSLNPRGRPRRGESLADALRAKMPADELAAKLHDLATTAKSEQVRLAALVAIGERTDGKAVATNVNINATDDDRSIDVMAALETALGRPLTIEEHRRLIEAADEQDPESTEPGDAVDDTV